MGHYRGISNTSLSSRLNACSVALEYVYPVNIPPAGIRIWANYVRSGIRVDPLIGGTWKFRVA